VAKLVAVTGGYSIDATEVTRDQYDSWLGQNPVTVDQDGWCEWNTTFTLPSNWPPAGLGKHPVVGVDWCDAYAYCKAVGKRLCGKIGGGTNAYGDYTSASLSQWHNACTSGGVDDYPYGSTLEPGVCGDGSMPQGMNAAEVGSFVGCQSSVTGYAGVYDLSGNVWEWEDSCFNASNLAWCRWRGGSAHYKYQLLRCDGDRYAPRDSAYEWTGFRCCSK
jgi:formylglycine-generating enzyme required for sulfatase activity